MAKIGTIRKKRVTPGRKTDPVFGNERFDKIGLQESVCNRLKVNAIKYNLPKPQTETIKSVTKCVTCGSECYVGGNGTTHFYIPKTGGKQ